MNDVGCFGVVLFSYGITTKLALLCDTNCSVIIVHRSMGLSFGILLSSRDVSNVITAWRKCVRRVMYLHYQTHCALLPLICNDFGIEGQLHNKFVTFNNSLIRSSNHCIQIIGKFIKREWVCCKSYFKSCLPHIRSQQIYRCALSCLTRMSSTAVQPQNNCLQQQQYDIFGI